MLSYHGHPPRLGSPWQGQAISFLLMTGPFILYFAISESSARRATFGKRILRLAVVGRSGKPLSLMASLLRNALKFVPWEFGHVVAHHAAMSDSGFAAWLWLPLALAMTGCMWWSYALFFASETPYNQWVGARVIRLASKASSRSAIAHAERLETG